MKQRTVNILCFFGIVLFGTLLFVLPVVYVSSSISPRPTPTPLRSAAPATPRPITTLNYFPAPCRAQATHRDHAYEWLCPNGDVYRTPLTF